MRYINVIVDYILEHKDTNQELKTFFRWLSIVCIVLILPKFLQADFFFGPYALTPPYATNEGVLSMVTHILPGNEFLMWPFLIIYVLGLFLLIYRRSWMISLLVYLIHLNLFNKGYLLFNSADMLLSLFLLGGFLYDLSEKSEHGRVYRSGLLLAGKLQVCFVYLIASLYKLNGTSWVKGEALDQVMQNDLFSSEMVLSLGENGMKIMTIFILIHQVTFPFLIWNKKLKIGVLIAGTVIHLGTAILMGLFDFGLVMILAYMLFLNFNELVRLGLAKKKVVQKTYGFISKQKEV